MELGCYQHTETGLVLSRDEGLPFHARLLAAMVGLTSSACAVPTKDSQISMA